LVSLFSGGTVERRLARKVAIVTGATKHSGATIVHRLAAEGAAVLCLGRSSQAGEAVAQAVRDKGGRATFIMADMAIEESVQSAAIAAQDAYGRLDVIVNHAAATDTLRGSGEFPAIEEPSETFDRMMKVNVYGPFWLAKYALANLVAVGGGSIINVSSLSAHRPRPGMPGYATSKAALEGLTRQLATDYAEYGIRVNAIALGAVVHEETATLFQKPAMSPDDGGKMLHRNGTPDDLASMIAYLAADEASYITGAVLALDGGAMVKYPAARIPQAGV
jgi:NAD(P)-dependent dehydrogenase (short-subunit alcohol dehydrogenase family)